LLGQSIVIQLLKILSNNRQAAARVALGRCILGIGAAVVVNGALPIATKSAGLCLRGNGKSMCCKYERKRADP
jgi:hypothetical protein